MYYYCVTPDSLFDINILAILQDFRGNEENVEQSEYCLRQNVWLICYGLSLLCVITDGKYRYCFVYLNQCSHKVPDKH